MLLTIFSMQSKPVIFGLLTSILCCADTPPLAQPEMQQILRALQTQFSQPEAVGYEALNRAAIAGLLQSNPQTIQLVSVPATVTPATPLKTESLTPRIACLRPGTVGREDVAPMREALTKLAAGDTAAVILDLRVPVADSDPALAAEFASLFLPKMSPVSSAAKTAADPVWTRDVVVLADMDTSNTGEILCALLQFHKRAPVIGSQTRGRTAAVVELPVRRTGADTLTLRFTAQRISFPQGAADPFGRGVTPDITAPFDASAKTAVFALQAGEGLARTVFQSSRPRTNEAALVARTNPEIPGRVARTAGKVEELPLIDRPLQLAVDSLTAQQALKP